LAIEQTPVGYVSATSRRCAIDSGAVIPQPTGQLESTSTMAKPSAVELRLAGAPDHRLQLADLRRSATEPRAA
jgi:hypothetical protein